MAVKSDEVESYVLDLEEFFSQIWKHNMQLNPKKCMFKVGGGKFLRFMVSHRGYKQIWISVKLSLK